MKISVSDITSSVATVLFVAVVTIYIRSVIDHSPKFTFGNVPGVAGKDSVSKDVRFRQFSSWQTFVETETEPAFKVGDEITVDMKRVEVPYLVSAIWNKYLVAVDEKSYGNNDRVVQSIAFVPQGKTIPVGMRFVHLRIVQAKATKEISVKREGTIATPKQIPRFCNQSFSTQWRLRTSLVTQ